MVSSRLAVASSRAGGVIGSVVGQEALSKSAAFALACWSVTRLARCASVVWILASISAVGQSVTPGCGAPQLCARERAVCVCVSRGFAPALILDERVQLGSLFVVQQIVKLLQRRLNRADPGNHRLDPLLHECETLRRRHRYLCRTGGFDVLRRFHGGVGEIVQRRTLGVIELQRLLDLIYRKARDVAAVVTAQLRQL